MRTRLLRNACPFAASMVCHRNIDINARRYAGRQAASVDPGQRMGRRDRIAHGGAKGGGRSRLNPFGGGPFLEGRSIRRRGLFDRQGLVGTADGPVLATGLWCEQSTGLRASKVKKRCRSQVGDCHIQCERLKPTVASRTKLCFISVRSIQKGSPPILWCYQRASGRRVGPMRARRADW